MVKSFPVSAPTPAKLAELRARTDRQLSLVIRRELERALPMAKTAVNKGSPLYTRAEKAYTRVRPLVSRLEVVTNDERTDLEAKLREVQRELERAASNSVPTRAIT